MSKRSQHTPGPWKWVDGPHLDGLLVRANYTFGDDFIVSPFAWGDNAEANARLIAAAPDLLACLASLAEVRNGRCTSCSCEIAPEGYCGCKPGALDRGDMVLYGRRCRARVAIAKAKGGAA